MTSEERKEARYQRRHTKRSARKAQAMYAYDDFDRVFTYEHLYKAYLECRKGVAWKASTQRYIAMAPLNVYQTLSKLRAGRFKSKGFYEFTLNERGKTRRIRSVSMTERVVQRCLCDYALVPALKRSFIYDNGASMKNKGYHFTTRRLCCHLNKHVRKHGRDGYILLFDFSKFFDRIPHRLVKSIVADAFTDERLIRLVYSLIDDFGDEGLGLGSQVSQILALASANQLDHYIKNKCGVSGYGRYMDDGYLIHESKDFLKDCLNRIRHVCRSLGIVLNERKTQIVKLRRGFTWLKCRYSITANGRIVRRMSRDSIVRMRRKLRKYAAAVMRGVMTHADVYASWQSWRSYARYFDSHRTTCAAGRLFNELFCNRKGDIAWTT